jgi:hypothetical protein
MGVYSAVNGITISKYDRCKIRAGKLMRNSRGYQRQHLRVRLPLITKEHKKVK